MSRGLGDMQRTVLASLEPAKRAYAQGKFDYVGGAASENVWAHSDDDSKFVRHGGEFFTLDDNVYDLRATLVYAALNAPVRVWPGLRDGTGISPFKMARHNPWRGGKFQYVQTVFRDAFMRAARSLVERGLLIRSDDEDARQLRFVSLRDDLYEKAKAGADEADPPRS